MYKELIKRKLAYLVQSTDTSIINSPAKPQVYRRFDENKEKEIIVWIRQQAGMDKDQIKSIIRDKFNISDSDAEKFYYTAYPDGLNSQEEELIEYFEQILPEKECQQVVDDSIDIILKVDTKPEIQNHNIDEETLQLFINFLQSMLLSRNII